MCRHTQVDGRKIAGKVQEKEKAAETYDDAISQGHGAYLLEQDLPDILTLSVGNLPPGGEATIRLWYVTELALEGSAVLFHLPASVAPRYIPPGTKPSAETVARLQPVGHFPLAKGSSSSILSRKTYSGGDSSGFTWALACFVMRTQRL